MSLVLYDAQGLARNGPQPGDRTGYRPRPSTTGRRKSRRWPRIQALTAWSGFQVCDCATCLGSAIGGAEHLARPHAEVVLRQEHTCIHDDPRLIGPIGSASRGPHARAPFLRTGLTPRRTTGDCPNGLPAARCTVAVSFQRDCNRRYSSARRPRLLTSRGVYAGSNRLRALARLRCLRRARHSSSFLADCSDLCNGSGPMRLLYRARLWRQA